ncbi:hypothetical protein L596_006377 [Steinernema carpocapsae]|uniref:alkaline phosphatase n=1 Tax=Steinernema carpocapsae TaxID=34508 RepID=A0A4U8V8H7_STECR|nr:hypothetical protein L596_006377 [Steinernema carpocapsae]
MVRNLCLLLASLFVVLKALDEQVFESFFVSAYSHYWDKVSRTRLNSIVQNDPILGPKEDALPPKPPKNLIFFLGDGMGITAVSAGRIYRSQKYKMTYQEPLNFEKFASSGLIKTYSYDNHVTDSAAGAIALFSGQKVIHHTLGLDATVEDVSTCDGTEDKDLKNIISLLALDSGKSVGFVTTTRITHATPAALYAKTVNRYTEHDVQVQEGNYTGCKDIASQLLDYPANQFTVLMGGGRKQLLPKGKGGDRADGRNIINEWKDLPGSRTVMMTRNDLLNVDDSYDHFLGMFSYGHLNYTIKMTEEDKKRQPSLEEMTTAAIKILSKNEKGYILLVEGGLIDVAEHENKMHYSLEELVEFDKAIGAAAEMVQEKQDTLMVVTADHSHTLTMPGYANRSDSIFGSSIYEYGNIDNLPIASLMFANGPGGYTQSNATHVYRRANLTEADFKDVEYVSPAAVPLKISTHSGEDVGIWAHGPYSRLFVGTMENTQVAYTIKYILCLDKGEANLCQRLEETSRHLESAQNDGYPTGILALLILTTLFSFSTMVLLGVQMFLKFRTLNESSSNECLRKF